MAESANTPDVRDDEKGDAKILADALERFRLADEAEADNRRDALDDLRFASGAQWDEKVKADREQDRRPCLTINRLPQHIKQITNDGRQNRPSIKAHPVDDLGDVETAKIYSGLIRHIEYNSNADFAYDTAFESAVRGGLGYLRVITDYSSPLSFEQEILIKRIRNPFSVFFDPFSQEPDGSDAGFAFITEDLSKDEYLKKFPKSKLAKNGEWESVGNQASSWIGENGARIAEYFYKDFRDDTLVLLSTNEVGLKSQMSELPEGVAIASERKTQIPVIRWCKINAAEILEKTEWLGSYIPIIPVYGEELDINGKRVLKGIVRDAKDPQRMLNFWKSAETEAIALAPKAPWLIEEGQVEGYEADWESANRRNLAYLKYKAKSVNGSPVPPPMRQGFEPAVQAITQAAMFAADDLKATTGIYDAALGAKSNETSGVAIQRRNVQAQTSNFHFIDNLTRSLRHTGRVLIDLIPKIYDTARTTRIIGDDGEQKVIKINQPFEENGKQIQYDMSVGKYDVTVDVGPSYASKRQEAAASMMEIARAVPQMMQVAGDLMVKNMDWPGAQEISERLKKTLPPGLADDPSKQNAVPPEAQAQMKQMGDMIEQMTGQLHQLKDEREQKIVELESRERIEFKKLEVQLEIKRAELDAKDSHALLSAEIDQINARLNLLRTNAPIEIQENEIPQNPTGGAPAEMGQEGMNPIGGESPSISMEGVNHANSSDLNY